MGTMRPSEQLFIPVIISILMQPRKKTLPFKSAENRQNKVSRPIIDQANATSDSDRLFI